MNSSLHSSIAPGKKIAAWVCLLAALLLWSPLWATALRSNGMACCDGTMCAAQGHSKMAHQRATAAATTQTEQPMDCEPSDGSSLMSCGASCCHDLGQAFVAAIQFLLPTSPALLTPQLAVDSARAPELAPVLQSRDPLYPPPRIALI